MKEASIPEEILSEIGISQKEDGKFPEYDELGWGCWCNHAEIEPDVDLVLEEDDVCFGLDLKV